MSETIEAKPEENGKVRSLARKPRQETISATSEPAQIVALIDRLARDPAVDVDKMERIMRMQMELVAQQAKRSYAAELAQMQPKLPVITERGVIEVRAKDATTGERTGRILQSTKYALWEDINDAIKPVLAEHGFSLSFRTGTAADGKLTVTGILGHRDGHQEETTIPLMHDTTGSKNAVQAVGSSTSYGKRYTACALLNITSRGEDDDGKVGGGDEQPTAVSPDQLKQIQEALVKNGVGIDWLISFVKKRGVEIGGLPEIPASHFARVMSAIKSKAGLTK